MALTSNQLSTLKADILADPAFSSVPMNDDGHAAIADAYNLLASPAFIVWKSKVTRSEIWNVVVWTEVIGRSVGERGTFDLMLQEGHINPSNSNVRSGFADIFSGSTGANTRNALLALSKRSATRAEKLFATGTGNDASPANMTFEGKLSVSDVSAARNS